jgi:hypothetical protein
MRAAHQARLRLEALKITMLGARLDLIETLIRESDFALDTLASVAAVRHFASRLGVEVVLMLLDLRLADQLANAPEQSVTTIIALGQQLRRDLDHHVPFSVKELAINGHDIRRLGIPPGPRLGQLLQRLLQQVLDDPSLNTRAHLLALARQEIGKM